MILDSFTLHVKVVGGWRLQFGGGIRGFGLGIGFEVWDFILVSGIVHFSNTPYISEEDTPGGCGEPGLDSELGDGASGEEERKGGEADPPVVGAAALVVAVAPVVDLHKGKHPRVKLPWALS